MSNELAAGLTLTRTIVQSCILFLILLSIAIVAWLVRERVWRRETAVPFLVCLGHGAVFYIVVLALHRPPSPLFTTWSSFLTSHVLFTLVGGLIFRAVLPHWRQRGG